MLKTLKLTVIIICVVLMAAVAVYGGIALVHAATDTGMKNSGSISFVPKDNITGNYKPDHDSGVIVGQTLSVDIIADIGGASQVVQKMIFNVNNFELDLFHIIPIGVNGLSIINIPEYIEVDNTRYYVTEVDKQSFNNVFADTVIFPKSIGKIDRVLSKSKNLKRLIILSNDVEIFHSFPESNNYAVYVRDVEAWGNNISGELNYWLYDVNSDGLPMLRQIDKYKSVSVSGDRLYCGLKDLFDKGILN